MPREGRVGTPRRKDDMQGHTTKYTKIGQAPSAPVEVWWEDFQYKLRAGAEVWLVLVQRGSSARPLTRSAIGRLCPSGLSPRQVEKQLGKLRRLGLIEDGVASRKQVVRRGLPSYWVTVVDRHAVGEARFKDGSPTPYVLMVPKRVRKAVQGAGSGRPTGSKTTKQNGVTSGKEVSPEAEQAPESLGNQVKRCRIVNYTTYKSSTGPLETSSSEEDAPSAAPVLLPKPVPALLALPGPRRWEDLPLGDKQAARHIFRLYNSYRQIKYKRPLFVRGDIARQKWWPALLAAVKELRARDIPPGVWIAWFDANLWKPAKPVAPPITALFSVKAIEAREAWFWGTQDTLGLNGRHWAAPASRELSERWRQHELQRRLFESSGKVPKPANLLSEDAYAELTALAEAQLESKRIETHDAMGAAEWLW